jgi:hypothetical protein
MVSATFLEDIQALLNTKQFQKDKKRIVDNICRKYKISQEAVYYRIRSYYGKPLREVLWDHHEPTAEEFLSVVKRSKTAKEVREHFIQIPNTQYKGIYDRLLGVSTFHKAKLLTITFSSSSYIKKYSPSVKDNYALIAASKLGGGSFPVRCGNAGIRIEHSAKQKAWLETKVTLFNRSFPWTHKKIHHTPRDTYTWWGGTFSSGKYGEFAKRPKIDMVEHLTPFGVWILFMDDGSFTAGNISFAVENEQIGQALINLFHTYGYTFKTYNENSIVIQDDCTVKNFMYEFLEPYRYLTPEFMLYKMTLTT